MPLQVFGRALKAVRVGREAVGRGLVHGHAPGEAYKQLLQRRADQRLRPEGRALGAMQGRRRGVVQGR